MYSTLFIVLLAALSFDKTIAGGAQAEPAPRQNSLLIGQYDQCDGKDAGNYTLVQTFTEDATCSYDSSADYWQALVQCSPNKQKEVNSLQELARSVYPAGAYAQEETLWLVTGGPLQGKYIYWKSITLVNAYLKRCSSVLGYSYVTSKSSNLLINEKLDLNVLISPTGGYEVFKKGCTTICSGNVYVV